MHLSYKPQSWYIVTVCFLRITIIAAAQGALRSQSRRREERVASRCAVVILASCEIVRMGARPAGATSRPPHVSGGPWDSQYHSTALNGCKWNQRLQQQIAASLILVWSCGGHYSKQNKSFGVWGMGFANKYSGITCHIMCFIWSYLHMS